MSRADTVREYYAAWVRDDLEAVLAMCTDDIVAVNVPIGPLRGKENVRAFFIKFGQGMTNKRYDVTALIEHGDIAVVEGVEFYDKHGAPVRLPYMSIFYFAGDKIREWRDYFDLETVQRQLRECPAGP